MMFAVISLMLMLTPVHVFGNSFHRGQLRKEYYTKQDEFSKEGIYYEKAVQILERSPVIDG